jgi:lysozyme
LDANEKTGILDARRRRALAEEALSDLRSREIGARSRDSLAMMATLRLALAIAATATLGCGPAATQPFDDVASTREALTVCPSGAVIQGMDVSSSLGTIDWSKAAGQIAFAIGRATDGATFVDASFATYRQGAEAAGVVFGAYHFFRNADPTAQAAHFLQTIGSVGLGEISPVLDFETLDGATAATASSNALTFLQAVETSTGRTPILYVPPYFYTSLGSPPALAAYPLWITSIGTTCPNNVPSGWTDWTIWQDSFTGSVAGIPGQQVDEDEFDGKVGDLQCVGVKCSAGTCVAGVCPHDGGADGDAGASDGAGQGDAGQRDATQSDESDEGSGGSDATTAVDGSGDGAGGTDASMASGDAGTGGQEADAGSAGDGGGGTSGAVGGAGGTQGADASGNGQKSNGSGGCGCEVAPHDFHVAGPAFILSAVALVRRRHRRRRPGSSSPS